LRHLGFIVKDLDKTMAVYRALGGRPEGKEWVMPARLGTGKLRAQFLSLGSLTLEFFQPFDGTGLQQKFLDEHGEGIQHFAFTVKDLDRETELMVKDGYKVLFEVGAKGGVRGAYFDAGKVGDILIELIQEAPAGTSAAKQ